MPVKKNRAMLVCQMPIGCRHCNFVQQIFGRCVCTAYGQVSLLDHFVHFLIVDNEVDGMRRHKDCPLLPVQDVEDAQLRAQLTIKDLLSEKCSPCHFCAENSNPDAGCKDSETSAWCEKHAAWNGKIYED